MTKTKTKPDLSVYWSWDEYVTKVETTEVPDHACGHSSFGSSRSQDWDKGLGWDDALATARTGWSGPREQVERLATHVEDQIDLELFQTAFEAVRDVAGSEVDIDRYLIGDPECMIESTPIRISRHGRAVRVVVPISYNCVVNEQTVVNRGAAVVALCDLLARAQHPVEVWGSITLTTHSSTGPAFCDLIRLQNANDALDVDRLLYTIAHPAAFRRLGFRSIEQVEDRQLARNLGSGYGYAVDFDPAFLPDQADNTICLPQLGSDSSRWTQEEATEWITGIMDGIFD